MAKGKDLNPIKPLGQPGRKYNESGRKPGDPSVELMLLMGELQRKRPVSDDIIYVGPELYLEAVKFIEQMRASLIAHPSFAGPNTFFCGHYITPGDPST